MKYPEHIITLILEAEKVQKVEPLTGGDINDVLKVVTDTRICCVKLNEADRFPDMFEAEAEGLETLTRAGAFRVPVVYRCGDVEGFTFLVMEFIQNNASTVDPVLFSSALAKLHKSTSELFGFQKNNYIGSLRQRNDLRSQWSEFYAEMRLLPLIRQLFDSQTLDRSDIRTFEAFFKEISAIFPQERPALLHGDLWSGNYLVDETGRPCLIDPAVYYGHREMDLGMMKLFGGFDNEIFRHYNYQMPLEKGWENRMKYAQLYPLLVHGILFGGGYVVQVKRIIDTFRS